MRPTELGLGRFELSVVADGLPAISRRKPAEAGAPGGEKGCLRRVPKATTTPSASTFSCPGSTRRRSVLRGIEEKTPAVEYIHDVETGPLVAPVLRRGRGRTVRALSLFPVLD